MGNKLLVAAAGMVAVIGLSQLRAQSTVAVAPKFDVVSIKACKEPPQVRGAVSPRGNSSPGSLRTNCSPLHDANGLGLIRGAYASDPFTPIDGGPSWIHSAFYEINATAEGNPSVSLMRGAMMQALLEEHFHLKIHHEKAEGPVYFLNVARGGPKLHSFIEGGCTPYSTPPPPLKPGEKYCNSMISALSPASVEAEGATLDEFVKMLRGVLDRPVINKTGINGRFDIRLKFSREGTRLAGMPLNGPPPASDPTGPPLIFTALQDELGLKLEPGKGPVDRFVIDHIERPSEN
jgi:uncharacterized protein (TIGR03435 family)